jgi:DUF438 domain-containing protein
MVPEPNVDRAQRLETLKTIIRRLHAGEPVGRVRELLKALLQQVDTNEIAAMEQQLIAEGMSIEEIMGMCDLHHQVLAELMETGHQPVPAGHPVDTLRRENEALRAKAGELRSLLAAIIQRAGHGDVPEEMVFALRSTFYELMDVEKHYRRKENLVFPFLERHGILGPSKVMWGKHDEARALLKNLGDALPTAPASAEEWQRIAQRVAEPALTAIEEMVAKEENILIPMTLERFTPEEWGAIWLHSPEIGWCLIDPRGDYAPPASTADAVPQYARAGAAAASPASALAAVTGSVVLPTGSLTLEQLQGIFSILPVDVTFVDHEDRVRFFSAGRGRVFVRTPAIIGRQVQHCHPPKSYAIVERILSDFRSGRESVAEFWITLNGRFIHIRYFAVRDAAGHYRGTLEVTQDATSVRALTGERRLLQYGPLENE